MQYYEIIIGSCAINVSKQLDKLVGPLVALIILCWCRYDPLVLRTLVNPTGQVFISKSAIKIFSPILPFTALGRRETTRS